MKKKFVGFTMVAMIALSSASFAGDTGPRPIKLSVAPPVEITKYYVEERLNEVTTSKESLE